MFGGNNLNDEGRMQVYICAFNKSSDFNEDLRLRGKDVTKIKI
jgi:hypothetical protein